MPALNTPISPATQLEFPNRSTENIVRWQPLAWLDLRCEIHSPAPSILRRAQLLFGARDASTPNPTSHPTLRWRVWLDDAPDSATAGRWIARDLDSGLTHNFKNQERALTFIEYSLVQSVVDLIRAGARPSLFAVHGALLFKNGCAIVVVGPSEAGKSTLACALWRNGWSLLSDDFCFLRAGAEDSGEYSRSEAYPAARRVSLRSGSRDLLGEETWARIQNAPSSALTDEGWLFHPHEIDACNIDACNIDARNKFSRAPVSVAAFVFLGRRASVATPAQMQLVDAAHAAISLLPYCTLLERSKEPDAADGVLDWGAALARIAPVVSHAAVYDLGRGALAEMVASVEALREKL